MATKLYFRSQGTVLPDYTTGNNDANLIGTSVGWQSQMLSTTAGTATATRDAATVAGPTNGLELQLTGAHFVWYSPPLDADITISGSITWNIWASEVNMADNVAINGRLEVIDGATGTITLIDQTARTTEVAQTTRTVNNFAETPGAGVACKRGDRLRVRIFGDDLGATAMGAGGSFTVGYNNTVAALADSWLQLTENLTFVSEPAGTTIYPTDTASAVSAASASLLSSFTGSDEAPLSEGGNWGTLNTSTAGLARTSNQAVGTATPSSASYWTPTNFGPDVEAYATVATVHATNQGLLFARVQGEGGAATYDGYAVRVIGTELSIRRFTNAAATVLATYTKTIASGDAIGIACHGDTIEAWHKPSAGSWALLGSVIDTTYPSAGKIALLAATASVAFDDVYAGTTIGGSFSGGLTEREAWTSRGAGVQTDVTNTAAGWTAPIQVTDTAGGTVVDWFTRQLTAFTLGGAVRVNARALSSNTLTATIRCEIARVASDGTSATVWGATTVQVIGATVGLTTSEAAASFLVSGDDLAVSDGQRLRIRFSIDDLGTTAMVTGRTVTLYYAGTSGGASGDTYLTFTQTLTESGGAVAEDFAPYVGGGYYPT